MIKTISEVDLYPWTVESLLEINIENPDNFLLIKETLTRIGVASKRDNTLYQTAHILHKRGRYYIAMFKELFQLDGRNSDITHDDIARRNTIAALLEQWGLCTVVNEDLDEYHALRVILSTIKIVSYKDKGNWNLRAKYQMHADRKPR